MSGIRDALARARELDRWQLDVLEGRKSAKSRPTDPSSPPSVEELLRMSYEEFRRADLVVLVRSAVLNEDITIASGEPAAERVGGDYVTYLIEEFNNLSACSALNPSALRLIQRLKRAFPRLRVLPPDNE